MEEGCEEFVTHSEGFGDCILFSLLDRDYLLSCGADGDIRILDLSGEKEPNDLYIGSSPLFQLAYIGGKEPGISFACEDNALYWMELNPADFSKHKKKILTRFGSAVYAVASDTGGQWLAAGAADFLIKLIPGDTVTSNSPKCHILDAHSAPVLALSFSSDGHTLCSAGCDGELLVWCTSSQTVKSRLPILAAPVSDLPLSPSRLLLAVSPPFPSGGAEVVCLIAVPHFSQDQGHCLAIVSSQHYQIIARLTSDASTGERTEVSSSGTFHCCCWAPDGGHLAAGTARGHVLLWSCLVADPARASFQLVRRIRHTLRGEIVSVCWGPSSALAALSKSGYLLLHESLAMGSVGGAAPAPAESVDNSLLEGIEAADLFDSQDSPPNFEPPPTPQPQGMELEETSGDGKQDFSNSPPDKPLVVSFRNAAKKRKFVPEIEEVDLVEPEYSRSRASTPPEPALRRQESFQPSSWPLLSEAVAWDHVCLSYNLVGVVISHRAPGASDPANENQHLNYIIEVAFHDRSVHHPMQLIDQYSFCLGMLTEEVLLLGGSGKRSATPRPGEEQSLIKAYRFNTWDGSKEWTASLPEGEHALSVSAGKGWVVCATDTCLLRLFGLEGSQFDLLRLPGTPLASAGRGGRLIVTFHHNSALSDSQCLGYYLLAVSDELRVSPLSEGAIPLAPLTELRWIGMTVSSLPAILDSAGKIHVGRISMRGVLWLPMLDFSKELRKKKYASCLVILGIAPSLGESSESESSGITSEEIRYILPSHGEQFPSLDPRPSVQCKSYSPPFCPTSSEKSTVERDCFLSSFSHGHAARRTQEGLMRMYALAARSGYFQRAMEIGVLLTPRYKQMAATYATQLQLKTLIQRMNYLISAENEALADPPPDQQPMISQMDVSTDVVSEVLTDDECHSVPPDEEIGHLLAGSRPGKVASSNIFSTGRSNPFKQKESAAPTAARASSIDKSFIKSVIQKSMGGKSAPLPSVSSVEAKAPVLASRQSTLTGEGQALALAPVAEAAVESREEIGTELSGKKALGFKEWLEQTLPLLEAESPQLNRYELRMLATKRWKEERMK